jgi:hypothetical protein
MAIQGWYYLTKKGDLQHRSELGCTVADLRERNDVVGVWPFDPDNRKGVWLILVESLAGGAKKERVIDLADKWGCGNVDAAVFAGELCLNLSDDGNQKCATLHDFKNLQESPAGFGDTFLEAMAALCKDIGYKPSKMWGKGFEQLSMF